MYANLHIIGTCRPSGVHYICKSAYLTDIHYYFLLFTNPFLGGGGFHLVDILRASTLGRPPNDYQASMFGTQANPMVTIITHWYKVQLLHAWL